MAEQTRLTDAELEALREHTPGPWFHDHFGNIWRRPPGDLYQYGGTVAGDSPVATAHGGWSGKSDAKFPVEANARVISAAPELLEALRLALKHLDTLYPTARGDDFLVDTCVAAIAKATGEAP